ncbi:cell wall-active antibiotics response protein LiaF [Fictibacillus iocasae]|uniref:Cell wall-active antibiotics response protein LiaF n=1 Tax=Fictibacillus iocasae TaxID=2715437 RepID=A0ABW2NRN1_9BACL
MRQKKKSDVISWILLIGVVLLLLEASFNGEGIVFVCALSAALIFLGRKKWHRTFGKITFWAGVIILGVTIFNLMAFKFLLIVALLFIIVQFYQSKQHPAVIEPVLLGPVEGAEEELYERKSLLQNVWFGKQSTPDDVYEWNDINVQCGVGDTVVDLSQTILPDGEAIIFIRNLIGNVKIMLPYEIDVSVQHSVLVGSTVIFEKSEPNIFNQTLYYRTKEYEQAERKVRILTSIGAGTLEVKRV